MNAITTISTSGTTEEKAEAAQWLREDAEYLRKRAAHYRENGHVWLAEKIQINADFSQTMAEELSK